jgi:dTDP-4-amino-4,6-dideoxygalactose transaminase
VPRRTVRPITKAFHQASSFLAEFHGLPAMAEHAAARRSAPAPIYVMRPSLPPLAEYQTLLRKIWATRTLTNDGPFVRELEARLARYLPAQNVIAVTNGTVALQLALRAVGGPKGIVVTTPFTFAATTTALAWEGFTPRFADIDRETFNLSAESVAGLRDDGVVGVLPVQVFGNPAGAREVAAVAKEESRWAIFDAAHSFGVKGSGGSLFDLGDASVLSFHATKNFHTFEGGAVSTRSRRIARRVQQLRNFGFRGPGDVPNPGINAKMNEAQAAMGVVNLRHVDRWIRARRERVELYRDLLTPLGVIGFQRVEATRRNFCYMPILLPTRRLRDRVDRHLQRNGIWPRRYFYPLTSDFTFLPKTLRRDCPVAEEIAHRILCLPLYPDLPLNQVHRIVACVRAALGSAGTR